MIVDTSAVITVLRAEPDAVRFAVAIRDSPNPSISVASVLECSLVAGPSRQADLDEFVSRARLAIIDVDRTQLAAARAAHRRFGRGSGSPARLNYGDCFSYALAKVRDEPLLFKGDDFTHTDLKRAEMLSPPLG